MRFVYIQLRLCVVTVLSLPGIWKFFIQVKMIIIGPYNNFHGAPTGARNSSLGHPNMAEASLGKNFPNVIPSLLHVFNGWYLQGWVIWCVSLSSPQNFWCDRRHIARRGGDISSRDDRISTRGCPNLPRLDKPGCPRLRKDARIWVKMPESRLAVRISDHWINHSVVSFLI